MAIEQGNVLRRVAGRPGSEAKRVAVPLDDGRHIAHELIGVGPDRAGTDNQHCRFAIPLEPPVAACGGDRGNQERCQKSHQGPATGCRAAVGPAVGNPLPAGAHSGCPAEPGNDTRQRRHDPPWRRRAASVRSRNALSRMKPAASFWSYAPRSSSNVTSASE